MQKAFAGQGREHEDTEEDDKVQDAIMGVGFSV